MTTLSSIEFMLPANTSSWQNLPRMLQETQSAEQRLEVLQAFGSCRTAHKVDLSYAEESKLTVPEWAALLQSLDSNPGFEELLLCASSSSWRPGIVRWTEEKWQALNASLAQVVQKASSLKKLVLHIGDVRQGPLLEQLGLNPNRALEELHLVCDFLEPDSAIGLYLAVNMIPDLPRLRKLVLRFFSVLQPVDRPTVQALSNALKENASLQFLEVSDFCKEGALGLEKVLQEAFTGQSACRNLKELVWTMTSSTATVKFGEALPVLMWNIPDLVIKINGDTFLDALKCTPLWSNEHESQLFQGFPWENVGYALRSRREGEGLRFERLTVRLDWDWCYSEGTNGAHWDCLDRLIHGMFVMWEISQQSPLLHLSLNWSSSVLTCRNMDFCMKPLTIVGLREVHFSLGVTVLANSSYVSCIQSVLDTFNRNTSIRTCGFAFRGTLSHGKMDLMRDLQSMILEKVMQNRSVVTLTLTSSFFPVLTNDVIMKLAKLQMRSPSSRTINIEHSEARERVSAKVISFQDHVKSLGSVKQAGTKRKNDVENFCTKRKPWGSGVATIEGARWISSLRASGGGRSHG